MPLPDSYAATVRLPVRISDGIVSLADGSALPALRKETSAELILDASDIANKADRDRLTREATCEILLKGTALWARVKQDDIPASLRPHREEKTSSPISGHAFVKFTAQASLRLIGSEGKRPVLADCACRIPSLPHITCASVNEAYTRISEAFEPSRRSHTGNVFDCVFIEQSGVLVPLEKIRKLPPAAAIPAGQSELL